MAKMARLRPRALCTLLELSLNSETCQELTIDRWRGMEGNSLYDASHDLRFHAKQQISRQILTEAKPCGPYHNPHQPAKGHQERHSIIMFQSIVDEMFPSQPFQFSYCPQPGVAQSKSKVASCFVRSGDE
jgi:hypothetical protein